MKVGTVCYATQQGIGHLAKNFYDAGVIDEVLIYRHGSRPTQSHWYPRGTPELVGRPFNGPAVEEFLRKIDVLIQFETPFDWSFLDLCRQRGVKTVIVPMYEWVPKRVPISPDKWICPSLLDQEYFPGSPYLPIPLPPCSECGGYGMPNNRHQVDADRGVCCMTVACMKCGGSGKSIKHTQRTQARRWLHNGGGLGFRGHKGTREIIKAMRHVKSDLTLTIRAQDVKGLHDLVIENPEIKRDSRVTLQYGGIERDDLFGEEFDVFVMAEKYNGLSLPLVEARAAGMVVVTSNRFPMNTWLPSGVLIPVSRYERASVSGAYVEYDEAVIRPEDVAATMDRVFEYDDVFAYSESAKDWSEWMSWGRLRPLWLEELAR